MEVPTEDEAAAEEKAPMKKTVTVAPGGRKAPMKQVVTGKKAASMENIASLEDIVTVTPGGKKGIIENIGNGNKVASMEVVVVREKGASVENVAAVAPSGKKAYVVASEKSASVENIAVVAHSGMKAPSGKKAPVQSIVAGEKGAENVAMAKVASVDVAPVCNPVDKKSHSKNNNKPTMSKYNKHTIEEKEKEDAVNVSPI
jgi:hypothetical protein